MKEAISIIKEKIQAIHKCTLGVREIRALVIDDELFDRVVRKRQLQLAGCSHVDTVESGEEALSVISKMADQKLTYDVITCDYNLSGDVKRLNGAQTVVLISKIPQCHNALVWCVSSEMEEMSEKIHESLSKKGNSSFLDNLLFTSKAGMLPISRKQSAPAPETEPLDKELKDYPSPQPRRATFK